MNNHQITYRVIFSDVDAGEIVYHARYFEMAERGRNEMMRAVGIPAGGFLFVDDIGMVLTSAKLKFKSPVVMDDLLTITTRVKYLSEAKISFCTNISRKNTLICALEIDLACVNRVTKKACFIPPKLLTKLHEMAPLPQLEVMA